jgi:aspartyl-tRNA(Asn)/glutamyl-tRNA(Gln) amidotransferase subunit C
MNSGTSSGPVLDDATVRHVAHLARIAITDDEVRLYAQQLSRVLDFVGQLNELSTENVPPTEHPLESAGVVRADAVGPVSSTADALCNAPDRHGDFFRVPKVLEQGDA